MQPSVRWSRAFGGTPGDSVILCHLLVHFRHLPHLFVVIVVGRRVHLSILTRVMGICQLLRFLHLLTLVGFLAFGRSLLFCLDDDHAELSRGIVTRLETVFEIRYGGGEVARQDGAKKGGVMMRMCVDNMVFVLGVNKQGKCLVGLLTLLLEMSDAGEATLAMVTVMLAIEVA